MSFNHVDKRSCACDVFQSLNINNKHGELKYADQFKSLILLMPVIQWKAQKVHLTFFQTVELSVS